MRRLVLPALIGIGLLWTLGLVNFQSDPSHWRTIGLVEGQGGTFFESIADVTVGATATLVDARRLGRTSLACTNTDASVNIRVGDSAVTASRGLQVRATNGFSTDSPAAVYAISQGANVTLACTRESR